MNILKKSAEMSAADLYRMTKNASIVQMKNAIGTVLNVTAWVIYEDTNQKGETNTITTIRDEDGTVYATSSPTFLRAFTEILEIYEGSGEQLTSLMVVPGTSKAGRQFITCAI